MYNALCSKVTTLSETELMEELEKLAVEEVVAVLKDVHYSTLINKSSEEKPSKPVTSDVTKHAKRAAKRARMRSAKYETTAAVEMVESVQNTELYEAMAKETKQHALEAAMVEAENGGKQSKVEPAT